MQTSTATWLQRLLELAAFAFCFFVTVFARAEVALLNVSYDPTRELYREINEAFAADWLAKTREVVRIRQSHGGSGSQARVIGPR